MKLRMMFFLSLFLLAVGASFAFTEKKQVTNYGYYYDRAGLCYYGEIYQDGFDCSPLNTGPACTIYDPSQGLFVPAFDQYESPFDCEYPLYQQQD